MPIHSFEFNAFEENTLVVYDETREAVIIDPGCYEPVERATLDDFITKNQLVIRYLLNTHCHIDHVLGNHYIKEKYKVKLLIHPIEAAVLKAVSSYAGNYGFAKYQDSTADQFINEGEILTFGNTSLEVFFLPGHSPGHVGFYHEKEKSMLSGDVLFAGSVGRTDLPGGDFDTLIESIQQKLFKLPDDVVVYPGHGPTTTLGREKISNPYCGLTLR